MAASTLVLTASAGLAGCERLLRALAASCPEDPDESGGVNWMPDVLHPVFYGYHDVGAADGAPGPVRVWYPTYEGFTDGPPILKLCLVRWPLVLFLHGQPPCPDANYYRRWNTLPAVLARCGYVVAVPQHAAQLPSEAGSPDERYALSVVDWMRSGWAERRWLDARASSTAVAGHSYGALLAARVAQARRSMSAYVGLSGPWTDLGNPIPLLQGIGAPSFFMWAEGNPITAALESMDGGGMWGQVPAPKHAAVLPGEHFDYLRPWSGCSFPRGDCTLVEAVAAELTALFLARRLPVGTSAPPIPVSLAVPDVPRTTQQQFFAGGHLNGLHQIATRSGCRVRLRWLEGAVSGTRQLGL
ncbi:MAG TPA: hypothetical protein PKZ76_08795 [Xanthomonadaceae bacterium]|nr:hypothetical protein [Xanthomonadaceae bacterium]